MLGHGLLELPHARFDLVQARKRRAQHIVHRKRRRIDRDLRNESDLFSLRKGDLAGIIVHFARQNFK